MGVDHYTTNYILFEFWKIKEDSWWFMILAKLRGKFCILQFYQTEWSKLRLFHEEKWKSFSLWKAVYGGFNNIKMHSGLGLPSKLQKSLSNKYHVYFMFIWFDLSNNFKKFFSFLAEDLIEVVLPNY